VFRRFRSFIAFLVLVPVVATSTLAAASTTPDERWVWDKNQKDSFGIIFQENSELTAQPLTLNGEEPGANNGVGFPKCLGVLDPKCKDVIKYIYFFYLPQCESATSVNCIEEFWAIDKSGKRIEGVRYGQIPARPVINYTNEGAPTLPTGSVPQLFRLPGVNHGGGTDLYSINAQVKGADSGTDGNGVWQFPRYGIFEVGVYPISIVEGQYGDTGMFNNVLDNRFCAHAGDNKCSIRGSFPEEMRFGLKVRLGWRASGWIHGRISDPIANFESTGSSSTPISVVSVEAEPVKVPTFSVTMKKSELPAELRRLYLEGGAKDDARIWGRGGIGTTLGRSASGEEINSVTYEPNVANGIDEMAMWLELGKDQAVAAPTYWSFKLRNAWDQCTSANSNLSAVLGTNATTYLDGPPVFNRESQSLDYRVSAPHLMPDGSKTIGTYDLAIDASVARCIYGFSNAPVSATISVVGEDGENRVAATTVRERDGWIYLSASGFTFSTPTLRVKLTQDKVVTEPTKPIEPIKEPVLISNESSKKKTITCVKGSKTKKVNGVKPKCPKGFKKR
jgi:hypothetical protein